MLLRSQAVCFIFLYKAAPDTPNISVVPSCTEVAVHWSVSSLLLAEGEPTSVTVSVTTGTVIIQANNTSTTSTSLTFHNLVSDSFYTITIVASNCAGRRNATIDIWTCKKTVKPFICNALILPFPIQYPVHHRTFMEIMWSLAKILFTCM